MRVVFMGTPDFAVPCLNALVEAGYEVVAVVTQPDRPKGRGQQMAHSPVKAAALAADLRILQPGKVREADFIATLRELAPEVIVVVAFGQILPWAILDLPTKGCINVHASLLPKYRGAAPIHWAVIDGEKQTGVTTMYMDIGLDTGDMLLKAAVEIGEYDTVGEVHDKLANLGARVLIETLANLDEIQRIPQEHAASTYAPMLNREHERITWEQDGGTVVNLIRGLNPWPGAYTTHNGKILKVLRAKRLSSTSSVPAGTVVEVDKNHGFTVQTGEGQVLIMQVQPQGGKKMEASAYARGYGLAVGDKLGE